MLSTLSSITCFKKTEIIYYSIECTHTHTHTHIYIYIYIYKVN